MVLSCPLDFRYGRPALKAIFSEEGKLERLLAVEASLARAHAHVGTIPKEAAAEISRKATLEYVSPERVHEIEAEIRHDLMAVVKALTEKCEGEAGKFVHFGATSYDIIDSANALMFRDGLDHIEHGLENLVDALAALAEKHRDTVMLGRTHGQAAVPMTFGLKMAVFLLEAQRHLDRLHEMRPRVVVGKMAGAVGTSAGLGAHAFQIRDFVAEDLGIGMEDGPTQIVQRDRYNELFGYFANLAASLEKFATEVRTLQRSEIDEVAEGFDVKKQVGSSTMAQKRNPVKSEKISGLARVVRSNVIPAYENSIQWNERDLANSSAERFIIPHAFVLMDEILQDAVDVFRNLVVKPENMRRNLDLNPGVMAENLLLTLTRKGLGRQDAHELIRQVTMRGGEFKKNLLDDKTVRSYLSPEEIAKAIDPASYTGMSGPTVDAAVAKVRALRAAHKRGTYLSD
ncbi:MAG TPA: adenylosuccinate lyase [Candidatus Thermoplasmatota archaeon]|nr:adenylosuccinate lyase [Candidatus Thermoplasmatota archaeon]